MSALDLNRLNTTIRRCAATLLDASYTDGIPTETTDVWRTIAADAARDLTDMIRRLRAAEAWTAWQPIETAPHGEWVLVYGTRFRAALPSVEPARLDEYGWADKGGYSVRPTHWQSLPTAPEAP